MAPTLIPGRLNAAYTRVAAANVPGFDTLAIRFKYLTNTLPNSALSSYTLYPITHTRTFQYTPCCILYLLPVVVLVSRTGDSHVRDRHESQRESGL